MSARGAGSNPPAILLAGDMIALAVARSLGAAGIPVYALGHGDDPVRRSRHCREFVEVGPGPGFEDAVMAWLERGPATGVLVPCSDEAVELVALHRKAITRLGYTSVEANDEAALAMLDKQRTFELATAAGIDVPWTETVTSLEEARNAAARADYPCALKPRHSHLFAQHFGVVTKAFIVADAPALERMLARTEATGLDMMITEIVVGPDESLCSYYSYLDPEGLPLLEVTKRKPRQYPPGFGIGSYHVTDWNPEVARLGLRFFQSAGIRGLANVEFKRDARDGRLKLIECNHRLTAATEQLRRAGADLPLFTYNRALGRTGPAIEGYRRGVGHWYPLRDARAFAQYRRRGELRFRDWAASLLRPQTFPLASFSDPLPSIASAARRGRRRLTGRRRRAMEARGARTSDGQPPGSRSMTSSSASSASLEAEIVGTSPTSPPTVR